MSVHNQIPGVEQPSGVNRRLIDGYLRQRKVQESAASQRIPRRPSGEPVPLSFSQQQVWLHSQMAGDVPVYNEAITIVRTGPLDVAILERCLAEIVRRHEIWRTTFDSKDGQVSQFVHSSSDRFPVESVDLRYLPEAERDAEAVCLASQDARMPFDLRKGPLLRATLVRTQDEEYRLYITFHQIVFDAVSAYRVLMPELAALYEAFSNGEPSPLPEPILQYGDFAHWQQKTLAADAWSGQLSFWSERLSGELPVLQWPNAGARPAYQTHRGAIHRFRFESQLIAPLTSFCLQEGISSYMACLAGYAALLSRYTGQQDIVIGGLSAGRRRCETESTVGYFVNPLALRVDLSGNPTFRELARQVRGTVLDALANDEVPFEKVVEELLLWPDPSRNPVFQLILSQQPKVPAFAPGWNLLTEEVSNGGSKVDMTIVLDERPGAISGPITYNPDLFDASTITRLVDHWQTLLARAIATPDRSIAEIPLLTESEREKILVDWNDTHVDYPEGECLHGLVYTQIERVPDVFALKSKEEHITYRELGARSNQLARYLQSLGIGADTPVGLYLERSCQMVVGLLGVLKAGGVCLPLDPTYPADRLSFMLSETQAPIIVTTKALEPELPQHNARVICLDADTELRSTPRDMVAVSTVSADNLAYIIYTSGSTGRPKGVQITHGNLVNSTLARSTYYKDPVESFLLLPSFAFDSSLAGIFWTLGTGGTLVLPQDEQRCDLNGLVELMVGHHVSHVLCVPALYRQLLEEASLEKASWLRVAIVAGEECPRELVKSHYRLLPQTALFNEYGPTEGSVWSSVYRCEPESRSSRVSIGRPIANAQIYILDTQLAPVPVGISGELHIAGAGVARGYLNQPDLSGQRFVPNPFGESSGGHLYKTGDLARYLPDGNIEYLGRVDQQVKIRGFRIELDEVEATLRACAGVRAAIVSVGRDARSEKRLVAHVVPETGRDLTATALREHLKRKLPEYMVPAAFVFLEGLPVTSNGKVDRQALTMPEEDGVTTAEFVAPRNDLETQLAKIWQEILGVTKISIRDSVFDMGAHSLIIASLLARIEREFGRRMSFASIFEAPTIEQFASLLRKSRDSSRSTEVIPLRPTGSKPPFFGIRSGLLWRPLSEHLPAEQPVLCVDFDPSILSRIQEPYSLKELAGHLVQAIREHCPAGPYHLGGFCDNALLAYETATQLLNQGQEVALLAIVDARNHTYFRKNSNGVPRKALWDRVGSQVQNLLELPKSEIVPHARQLLEEGWQRASRPVRELFLGARAHRNGVLPKNLDEVLSLAQERYKPKPYFGRVVLLRADTKSDEALSGWRDLVKGPLAAYDIPGTHFGIFFEPHVQHLARRLAASMNDAIALVNPWKP